MKVGAVKRQRSQVEQRDAGRPAHFVELSVELLKRKRVVGLEPIPQPHFEHHLTIVRVLAAAEAPRARPQRLPNSIVGGRRLGRVNTVGQATMGVGVRRTHIK